jgi:hypothetical protein
MGRFYHPTGCWLLWLRSDLDRDAARDHWRGPHARCVARVRGIHEYRQLHFSERDHGFWSAPAGVATRIPADWRIDGMPEVAFARALPSPRLALDAIRHVFPDEANAFHRVLGHFTGPHGGRWFAVGDAVPAGARAVALLRRRPGVRPTAFNAFVHDLLGPALARASGTLELRTHSFLPYSWVLWRTPGVAHDNPPHRRYHAAVVLGAADRAALNDVLRSPQLGATGPAQAKHCVAVHAYAVEETVAVVRDGGSEPSLMLRRSP